MKKWRVVRKTLFTLHRSPSLSTTPHRTAGLSHHPRLAVWAFFGRRDQEARKTLPAHHDSIYFLVRPTSSRKRP